MIHSTLVEVKLFEEQILRANLVCTSRRNDVSHFWLCLFGCMGRVFERGTIRHHAGFRPVQEEAHIDEDSR